MSKIATLLEWPIKTLKLLIGLNMLISLLLLFINVCLRTFFNTTIEWAETTTIYLIMWNVFLGTGLVFAGDEHLSMGLLYDHLSDAWKKKFEMISLTMTVLASLFLIYFGFSLTKNLYLLGQKSLDGLIPLYLVMASIPIGAIVTIIAILAELYKKRDQRSTTATGG